MIEKIGSIKKERSSEYLDRIGLENIVISSENNRSASILAKNKKVPCVIFGETGTGKEEFAKLVHKRRIFLEGNIPLECVNCANINGDLSTSLLFGHAKGSFSGAERATSGIIDGANGGILFLDEIHALSLETQQRLLRVLNDGTYNRLGESTQRKSTFQVLAASTRDLDKEVENGNFILDLRSRLIGIEVELKPLRERLSDLHQLTNCYFRLNRIEIEEKTLQDLVKRASKFYWQGNIRQLFSVYDAWIALCEGALDISKFPCYRSMLPPQEKNLTHNRDIGREEFTIVENVVEKAINLEVPLDQAMNALERYILQQSMIFSTSMSDVYRGLNLSRNSFYTKRRKYGLAEN